MGVVRRHGATALLGVSALVLSAYVALMPGSTLASLGRWNSDHYSHYGAAILFWHRGVAVFRTPATELCAHPDPDALALAARLDLDPLNICVLPERAGERPLFVNWQEQPRPYPPGALLFAAPEALLYAHTSLSMQTIDRLAIIQDLIAGHVLVALLLASLFGGAPDEDRRRWRSVGIFLVPLVYFSVIPFAMTGFYDTVAIACLCVATDRLRRDDAPAALLWLALAAFLHFRAFWYAPLGVSALARLRGQPLSRRDVGVLAGAGVLLAASLFSFALVAPALGSFPRTNSVMLSALTIPSPARFDFIILVVVVTSCLAWQRQWLLCALVGWQILMIGLSVQAQAWHAMFLLPLLSVARWKRAEAPAVLAIVVFIIGLARIVYYDAALPGAFLYQLLLGKL